PPCPDPAPYRSRVGARNKIIATSCGESAPELRTSSISAGEIGLIVGSQVLSTGRSLQCRQLAPRLLEPVAHRVGELGGIRDRLGVALLARLLRSGVGAPDLRGQFRDAVD